MSILVIFGLIISGLMVAIMFTTAALAFRSAYTLVMARRSKTKNEWLDWMGKHLMARYRLHSILCPFQWIRAEHEHEWICEKRTFDGEAIRLSFRFNHDEP